MYNSTASTQVLSNPLQARGVAAIGAAGLLSVLCCLALFCCFGYSIWRERGRKDNQSSGLRRFLRSALGLYLVSTLAADLILGAAYVLNFHWYHERSIYQSGFCQVQAGLIQFSDFLTGMSTLALSIHTFIVLVPMRSPPRRVAHIAIPIFWLLSLFTAFVGPAAVQHGGNPFYGVAGSWCYIGSAYSTWRFILLYDLIWMTMLVSTVCYIWVFLSLAGVVRMTARFTISTDGTSSARHERQLNYSTSRKMLFYPFSYLLVFLPVSVIRLLNLTGKTVPLPLNILAGVCLASSGTINSVLFVATRWTLLSNIGQKPSTIFTSGELSVSFPDGSNHPVDHPSALRRSIASVLPISLVPLQPVYSKERHSSKDSGSTAVGPKTDPFKALVEEDGKEDDDDDDGKRMDFFAVLRSSPA